MWSVPYSHDLHENMLGLFVGPVDDDVDFSQLYHNKNEQTQKQTRVFYNDLIPIRVDDKFEYVASGIMGNTHKPHIFVDFRDKSDQVATIEEINYAPKVNRTIEAINTSPSTPSKYDVRDVSGNSKE